MSALDIGKLISIVSYTCEGILGCDTEPKFQTLKVCEQSIHTNTPKMQFFCINTDEPIKSYSDASGSTGRVEILVYTCIQNINYLIYLIYFFC